ncbi:MAG: putative acetyltransferase [Gaiellaceae bacterium]|nr:putative acetyltransferase [Gaiellaceae bacterium]
MIRVATDDDWPAILEVHRRAFGDDDVPRICVELRSAGLVVPSLSFVSLEGGRVAGHVMNSWVGLEGSDERLLQLSPLGVLPELQGRGHGSALVRASLAGARGLGEQILLVEGNPAYYGRFGFVRADELGLLPPPEALHDWAVQVAVLDETRALPRGRVVYSDPFR